LSALFAKPLRLDTFQRYSKSLIASHSQTLHDTLINRLVSIVLSRFEPVGPGWFDTGCNDYDTYRLGKLNRFLSLVGLTMECFLENSFRSSSMDFLAALESRIPVSTDVQALNYCANTWLVSGKPMPLFVILRLMPAMNCV
jgi:hypothetical protein